jgi:hypothetical protein
MLAQAYLDSKCTGCASQGDVYTSILVTSDFSDKSINHVSVEFNPTTHDVTLMVLTKNLQLHMESNRVMSMADLPGSVIIIDGVGKLFQRLSLESFTITTDRGQEVFGMPEAKYIKDHRVFVYKFPQAQTSNPRPG